MPKKLPAGLLRRARRIRLLLMDVDGVLTDGLLYYAPDGHGGVVENKGFDSQDGMAMRWIQEFCGIRLGWISGRESPAVTERARQLQVAFLYQGHLSKLAPYEEIVRDSGVAEQEICYVGDDLTDAPVLLRVGLPVAVANARPEIKALARYVTRAPGGRAAIREVAELLMRAQGQWDKVLRKYGLRPGKVQSPSRTPKQSNRFVKRAQQAAPLQTR